MSRSATLGTYFWEVNDPAADPGVSYFEDIVPIIAEFTTVLAVNGDSGCGDFSDDGEGVYSDGFELCEREFSCLAKQTELDFKNFVCNLEKVYNTTAVITTRIRLQTIEEMARMRRVSIKYVGMHGAHEIVLSNNNIRVISSSCRDIVVLVFSDTIMLPFVEDCAYEITLHTTASDSAAFAESALDTNECGTGKTVRPVLFFRNRTRESMNFKVCGFTLMWPTKKEIKYI